MSTFLLNTLVVVFVYLYIGMVGVLTKCNTIGKEYYKPIPFVVFWPYFFLYNLFWFVNRMLPDPQK